MTASARHSLTLIHSIAVFAAFDVNPVFALKALALLLPFAPLLLLIAILIPVIAKPTQTTIEITAEDAE